jgi:hypothetical protein
MQQISVSSTLGNQDKVWPFLEMLYDSNEKIQEHAKFRKN